MFDKDTYSLDDYLGKVVITVDDYICNEAAKSEKGLFMTLKDDPYENSPISPTTISGKVAFQLRFVEKYLDLK